MTPDLKKFIEQYPFLSLICTASAQRKFKAGQNILTESGNFGFAVCASGSARAFFSCDDGREITLFTVNGKSPLFNIYYPQGGENSFEIALEAETDCEFFIFDKKTLNSLCKQNAEAENLFLKNSGALLLKAAETLSDAAFSGFEKRLSCYLLSAAQNGVIEKTHFQIANDLGSAREVVSRMLKNLKEQNAVSLSRGKIKIENADYLKALSGR